MKMLASLRKPVAERGPSRAELRAGERRRAMLAILCSCAMLLPLSRGLGQSFVLDWWDADAGATSSGGIYSLSGTLGQPDAGILTGGPFTLVGGFWGAFPSLQPNPSPPWVSITATSTNTFLLSWPFVSTPVVVQTKGDPGSTGWSDTNLIPANNGVTSSVVLPPASGTRFYRLKL
jgi:hypothetical protein